MNGTFLIFHAQSAVKAECPRLTRICGAFWQIARALSFAPGMIQYLAGYVFYR